MNHELKSILKNSSLLLIEDDINVREKFIRLIGIYVNNIFEASNGLEALEIYKKNNISFIITDIKMPELNGLQFVEFLRNENKNIPIIVISSYYDKEYLLNFIPLELSAYLIKPIKYNELGLALEKVALKLKSSIISGFIEIYKDVFYDANNKNLIVSDQIKQLTNNEDKLLQLLLLNRGGIVTKEMVEKNIYIFKEMGESSLKNLVYKLRKKIEKDILISVGKVGYKID